MTMTPLYHSLTPEQARPGEMKTAAVPPVALPHQPAGRRHLSFEAAEQAMRGVLTGEDGEHLADCSRCQSLVQNMRPKAEEAERFARWAAQHDTVSTPGTSAKIRRPAKRAGSL